MLPESVICYGTEDPPAVGITLRAGPLSMVFEPETGFLRYIRMGDREVLRGIYAAVRDHNWDTITPRISGLRLEQAEGSFRLSFDVMCKKNEVDFFWKGSITGGQDGRVCFTMEGIARSSFRRGRIGFCILHPAECAGQPCVVETVDGAAEEGMFPKEISAHQPFVNIRAISHEVRPEVLAEVRFAGEVFEMEDQRNWTDASFKTYCTPLEIPFPVAVPEGTEIAQSVVLTLKGSVTEEAQGVRPGSSEAIFTVGETPSGGLPRIGLGAASHGQAMTDRELARLKALNLSHLRVDLKLSEAGFAATLERVSGEAEALGVPLEVAIVLTDVAEDELRALAKEVARVQARISTWLVFHVSEKSTGDRWVRLARRMLSAGDSGAKIGGGTNAYFTELNRGWPPTQALDLVCYSLNSQVHAFDNASLVETLKMQACTVESARQFTGGLPLAVTPVSLKPRFNPNATGPEPEQAPDELPPEIDVRQASLFGAGWTLGSLKYLSESGVECVTYYETTGWRGVMEVEGGCPIPEKFCSIPGGVFPLYHVLADVGAFADGRVIPSVSSDPPSVEGMALEKAGQIRILLANLGPDFQPVRLVCPGLGAYVRVKRLDRTNAERAMRAPEAFRDEKGLLQETSGDKLELSLSPYAVVRIDPAEANGG